MNCVPALCCHPSAPFVPLAPGFCKTVGITILYAPFHTFPKLGQGMGQREFPGIHSLMKSAENSLKNVPPNNEGSVLCPPNTELAFSRTHYKVILKTGCLRRKNIVPLSNGTKYAINSRDFLNSCYSRWILLPFAKNI